MKTNSFCIRKVYNDTQLYDRQQILTLTPNLPTINEFSNDTMPNEPKSESDNVMFDTLQKLTNTYDHYIETVLSQTTIIQGALALLHNQTLNMIENILNNNKIQCNNIYSALKLNGIYKEFLNALKNQYAENWATTLKTLNNNLKQIEDVQKSMGFRIDSHLNSIVKQKQTIEKQIKEQGDNKLYQFMILTHKSMTERNNTVKVDPQFNQNRFHTINSNQFNTEQKTGNTTDFSSAYNKDHIYHMDSNGNKKDNCSNTNHHPMNKIKANIDYYDIVNIMETFTKNPSMYVISNANKINNAVTHASMINNVQTIGKTDYNVVEPGTINYNDFISPGNCNVAKIIHNNENNHYNSYCNYSLPSICYFIDKNNNMQCNGLNNNNNKNKCFPIDFCNFGNVNYNNIFGLCNKFKYSFDSFKNVLNNQSIFDMESIKYQSNGQNYERYKRMEDVANTAPRQNYGKVADNDATSLLLKACTPLHTYTATNEKRQNNMNLCNTNNKKCQLQHSYIKDFMSNSLNSETNDSNKKRKHLQIETEINEKAFCSTTTATECKKKYNINYKKKIVVSDPSGLGFINKKLKTCHKVPKYQTTINCKTTKNGNHYKYECEYCQKRYKLKRNYRDHLEIHNGNGFKCTYCEKVFARKPNLHEHLRIHNGIRPYKCKYCGKGFTQKHVKDYHEKSKFHYKERVKSNIEMQC